MLFFIVASICLILIVAAFVLFFESKKDISEKALALAAMGNYVEARAMVRDYLEGSPNDVKSLFVMAKIYSMEGDFLSEASYLDKIKKAGKFDREFPDIYVCNRIADIYYQLDMFEESFFYYMDSIQIDPENMEALLRLAFMSIGQKDFQLADYYFRKIPEDEVKIPSYYIARGVISAMLERGTEGDFFEKGYNLDRTSAVAGILYAISIGKNGKHDAALEIANKFAEAIEDEFIRYTVFQFITLLYMNKGDFNSGMKHARLCMEIAKLNGWQAETVDSSLFFSMNAIALGKLEEAAEFLIEAENERPDDPDIIALANYKFAIEEGKAEAGKPSESGYDLIRETRELILKLFPDERYFELSGLRSAESFNIRGIVGEDGKKITNQLNLIGVDKLTRFNSLKGNAFKNTCTRMIMALNYRVTREIPYQEADGANYIGTSMQDRDVKCLFRIRKWKGVKISDVFLRDLLSAVSDLNVDRGYIIGSAELTSGAKKAFLENQDKITIVNGKDLDNLLEKSLR